MSRFLDLELSAGRPPATQLDAMVRRAARWRISVFALVRGVQGGWLLVRQRRTGRWNLPGGRVKEGESLRAALRREFFEEAGFPFVGHPRLCAVVEQPARGRLRLYFRVLANPHFHRNYQGNPEIAAANNFAGEDFPGDQCEALRLWLRAGGSKSARGLCWRVAEVSSPSTTNRQSSRRR